MDLNTLKEHFTTWASSWAPSVESEWHKAVTHFVSWVEGAQAEQDAVSLLTGMGYHVEPPPAAGPVDQPASGA